MSCGELGKGAKTGEAVEVCCGEFETCREACAVRADRFKWQRDELLDAAVKAAEEIRRRDYEPARFTLLLAISSVKGGAA